MNETRQVHRLALVIHSLAGGGAERSIARLADHWARRGCRVTLITLADPATDPPGAVAAEVERIGLNQMGHSPHWLAAVYNNWQRVGKLRRALRAAGPDLVVSFTEQINVLTLLASRTAPWHVVICERTDPRHHGVGPAWSWLRKRTYPWCTAAVVQTAAVQRVVRDWVGGKPVYVIPNDVAIPGPSLESVEGREPGGGLRATAPADAAARRWIVGLGRLSREKGFDLLLEAFQRVCDRHPEWGVRIYGEGDEREALERQAALLAGERIALAGWTDVPHRVLREADLFVLPSRYEGFPNALLEAMAAGRAVVAFDCDSGPREMICDGHDGRLVPAGDVTALAQTLDELMGSEGTRRRLGEQARAVTARYSTDRLLERWDELLAQL